MSNTQMIQYTFSHLLLAGTTAWCVYNSPQTWKFMYGSYGALSLYSLVGVWRFGNPKYGVYASDYYCSTNKLVQAFALPCFIAELCVHYGCELSYTSFHIALPLIPIGLDFIYSEWEQDLIDGIILVNIISGCGLSFLQKNYFAILVNANYLITHFVFKNSDFFDVPAKILYNVGLNFFLFYAYKALMESQPV